LWDRALHTAQNVIVVDSVMTDTIREHADVVFPAEAYAEKEGTLVHPDGRVQRLRPAIGRPRGRGGMPGSGVRPLWQVLSEIARELGHEPGAVLTGAQASERLFAAVPFYAGLTLDEIGGRGVRWPERHAFDAPEWEPVALDVPAGAPAAADGTLRLGTFRSLWASKEVDVSPALQFVRPRQVVELSPEDARSLGINEGDRVEVGSNGTRVKGAVRLRAAVPGGSVFVHEDGANVLTERLVEVRRIGPGESAPIPSGAAVEGSAEMPPSAPLPIPPREAT
jgi:NADH-quinone oxidoreductase subunit G